MKPAIIAVGYNRPDVLKRLLSSINNAYYCDDDVTLVISLDKAKNESDIVKVAEEFEWKHGTKVIRRFSERQGLRKHILQCGDLSNEYDAVIILEDDLIVSPSFYLYTQTAIDFYSNEQDITGIALYSHEWNGYSRKNFQPVVDRYDTYIGQYSITWGQCWTCKWWNEFRTWYDEHEDKLEFNYSIPRGINGWSDQSWGKYFVNYIVEKNKFYVIPRVSMSTNCSEAGEHVRIADNVHQVKLQCDIKKDFSFAPVENAMRYDIFFESISIKKYFEEYIINQGLTIDLAGYGRINRKDRYLLSTNSLPYKMIKSYGLQMRPYEMNVVNNIQGDNIFLYDTHCKAKSPIKNTMNVMRFEIRGFSVRDLTPYYFGLLKEAVSRRVLNK